MEVYYYEDPNGAYRSGTDARRFSRVAGREAYAFLQAEEGRNRRFARTGDGSVHVEVPAERLGAHRRDERREQYAGEIRETAGFTIVPLHALRRGEDSDELLSGEELIADESEDVAEAVARRMDLETLRGALCALPESDYRLIYDLFLREDPMTEAEAAGHRGKSQQMISKDKRRILAKLKGYFEGDGRMNSKNRGKEGGGPGRSPLCDAGSAGARRALGGHQGRTREEDGNG